MQTSHQKDGWPGKQKSAYLLHLTCYHTTVTYKLPIICLCSTCCERTPSVHSKCPCVAGLTHRREFTLLSAQSVHCESVPTWRASADCRIRTWHILLYLECYPINCQYLERMLPQEEQILKNATPQTTNTYNATL